MYAIETEGLGKRFRRVRALDGLTLAVEPGSIFGFLGPNGAGKTTTIRILAGLARPTSGRAAVSGLDVVADRAQVARRIGYLPEDPAFYTWMTPLELLDHVGRIFGLSAEARRSRSRELLGLAGLAEVGRRRIGGFSRGMRQRLGLAQALMNEPDVLVLDEPASALDPAGRKEVLELIGRLRDRCTVFMSTHILADVERVCDTIGIIDHGRMVAIARQEELLARYAIPAFELSCEPGGEARLAEWGLALEREPWVASVALDNATARVVVDDVAAAKARLLPAAVEAGLVLTRYEMVRPSLEDVFLRLVGPEGQAA